MELITFESCKTTISDINDISCDTNAVDYHISYSLKVLPTYADSEQDLIFLTYHPITKDLFESLSFIVNRYVKIAEIDKESFEELFKKTWKRELQHTTSHQERFGVTDSVQENSDEVNALILNNSVTEIIDIIITKAINLLASDIHFEPLEHNLKVRFRIDGELRQMYIFPKINQQELLSRLKIMASLDIAEKRKPQDGKIIVKNSAKIINIRVSTMPVKFGEKVVLRLLDKAEGLKDIDSIGLLEPQIQLVTQELTKKSGIILITGPTGSGKTTTLYTFLRYLHSEGINISTVEDPIEYHFDGMNQTQYNPTVGYDFANAIKTFLRQDPDIIMVGEIRDIETAKYAIQAAQTGHLVFSTLHTNDAPSAVTRLLDMGVDPYLISSSLNLVLAQRLVRKVCPHCVSSKEPTELENNIISEKVATLPHTEGCDMCNDSGYMGRLAIVESMQITEHVKSTIAKTSDVIEIRNAAKESGFVSLKDNAVEKVKEGLTTLSEISAYLG